MNNSLRSAAAGKMAAAQPVKTLRVVKLSYPLYPFYPFIGRFAAISPLRSSMFGAKVGIIPEMPN